ncbi:hypothetical protein LMH73_025455, partial [Vibrio splendidus]
NATTTKDDVSMVNMLQYLYVTPYEVHSDYMNKMIYFRNPSIKSTCDLSKKGKYLFADVEGGSINHFPVRMPSPAQSLAMSLSSYRESINSGMKQIKEDYCLDVNLAPVMDFSMRDRTYFDDKNGEFDKSKFSSFVEVNKANDIRVTYKHYPPSYHNDYRDHDQQAIAAAKKKWSKPDNALASGYSEVWEDQYIGKRWGDVREISDDLLGDIVSSSTIYDMIMLDNALFSESNYEPYVSSALPQSDEFLMKFKGLIITDDLYQLNINTINIKNLFINADLFLITSIHDWRILNKRLLETISNDKDLLELLVKKYNKVKKAYPMKKSS